MIGHTGSGKSTLVQLLNGLLRPSSGTVLLEGADIWAKPKEMTKVRFRVGLVMQYPEYQLFDATVRGDIGFGPRNMGLLSEEIDLRVSEAARFVGIESDIFEKSPFDLSGGQRRRVAIAGVIAMRPDVLILDEPAAGLDPRGRREIHSSLSCRSNSSVESSDSSAAFFLPPRGFLRSASTSLSSISRSAMSISSSCVGALI